VSTNADARFVALVRSWLVSLPHDLKIAFEAMDDENLPHPARELAAGAVVYVVSPHDFIVDRSEKVAGYVDDAILLRLALRGILAGEEGAGYKDRFPEVFESLDKDLELCRTAMGDLMGWLEGKVGSLVNLEHKGKKALKIVDDDEAREELFEQGLVFRTDYPIDEETIGDKLKKASTVTDVMKRRRAEEVRLGTKSQTV
jgi:uncharacterized membrane protein YkvA (DUF1232 family)